MIKEREPRNLTILRNKLAEERYTASRNVSDSIYHGHDFYEFMICLCGKGRNSYNFQKDNLMTKGMIFFSRLGEKHKITGETDDFAYDNVYVTKQKMEKICNALSDNLFDKINAVNGPIYCTVDFDKLKYLSELVYKLSNVIELSSDDDAEHSLLVLNLLNIVLDKYIFKKAPTLPKWLENIRERISKPENFIIPLGDLLNDSFYSRAYISVAFKKYMGETVVEYRNRIRVKYSVAMLSENDMSINRIAGILGWDNPNNYIIAFKKVYGITPLQYKNSRLKNE